jgi:hypothetical protein
MLLVWACLLLPAGLSAQEGQLRLKLAATPLVDVDRNIPRGQKAGRYDIAVLVGNRNYRRPGVPAVDFAHNDLAIMKRYLVTTMGFDPRNILEERDATKGVFELLFGGHNSYQGQLYDYVRPGKSKVFIYYVGHGAPDRNTGEGYFVPVDSSPDYVAATGYPISTFYANLKKLPAKELVVVLDACFSGRSQNGLLLKNVSPGMLRVKTRAAGLRQGAVMSSAGADQLSAWYPEKSHSLYSYYFFKGLQGEADGNGDKRITTGEMDRYLSGEVPYWARRLAGNKQQPKMEGKQDIVLATLK